ncbi:MAG TPA: PQQ-binding-like beta-propeller repeat protein [Hanamia sp.]|nr:PQQ-binding-like beta-propeller repeat protein [Hanamia sp.]
MMFKNLLVTLVGICLLAGCASNDNDNGWTMYGGNSNNNHYSSLSQIDTNNVTQLQVAWTYHAGDVDTANHSQIQCNPIIIDNVLYGTSPLMKLFAVDATTGKQKWIFNPFDSFSGNKRFFFIMNNCRGVAYWSDGKNDKRIFYTAGSDLYSINAENGKPEMSFGDSGKIDLHNDLGRDVKDLFVTATSPGVVYKNLIIMGTRVDEGPAAAPGHIRAYDVRTGKLKWIFHTIPYPNEVGYNTWEDTAAYRHIGGANAWSGLSLDEKNGIVFAPTGSASFDFYGGKRRGDDLFANTLLALDASTGKRIWHFQSIHHDLWDHDLSSPPALVTIHKDGKKIEAVAITTKTGFVFVLDRKTGNPVYPIVEKPVPHISELVGEYLSPTQPYESIPKPFVRQLITENDLNTLLPDSSYADVKKRFQGYKHSNMFEPLSKEGTIVAPGLDGGAEWGGPSYDPTTGILYVNANEMVNLMQIVDLKTKATSHETFLTAGVRLYQTNCMGCHGPKRQGSGNYPSLIGVNKKYNEQQFVQLISTGRRMMPAFKQLNDEEKKVIASFILDNHSRQSYPFIDSAKPVDPYLQMPYAITGYNLFLSKEGLPAISPPYGTLTAINLNTGKYVWRDTLGDYPYFAAKGLHTGSENYGSSAVTKGGLLFIAATRDGHLRAFNKRTGQLLWEYKLPAAAFATPSVYEVNGREYIVIACGGGKLGTTSGDSYIAFALPR